VVLFIQMSLKMLFSKPLAPICSLCIFSLNLFVNLCHFCIMCIKKALSMNVREYLCLSLQEGVFVFVQSLLSKHTVSCLQIFLTQCCFPLVCTHKYMSMLRKKVWSPNITHTHTHTHTVRQKSLSSNVTAFLNN